MAHTHRQSEFKVSFGSSCHGNLEDMGMCLGRYRVQVVCSKMYFFIFSVRFDHVFQVVDHDIQAMKRASYHGLSLGTTPITSGCRFRHLCQKMYWFIFSIRYHDHTGVVLLWMCLKECLTDQSLSYGSNLEAGSYPLQVLYPKIRSLNVCLDVNQVIQEWSRHSMVAVCNVCHVQLSFWHTSFNGRFVLLFGETNVIDFLMTLHRHIFHSNIIRLLCGYNSTSQGLSMAIISILSINEVLKIYWMELVRHVYIIYEVVVTWYGMLIIQTISDGLRQVSNLYFRPPSALLLRISDRVVLWYSNGTSVEWLDILYDSTIMVYVEEANFKPSYRPPHDHEVLEIVFSSLLMMRVSSYIHSSCIRLLESLWSMSVWNMLQRQIRNITFRPPFPSPWTEFSKSSSAEYLK